MDLLPAVSALADAHRAATDDEHKSTWGQFFTPGDIAAFMAGWIDAAPDRDVTVLDAGAGTGILGIAAALALFSSGARSVHLVAVEAEAGAREGLARSLTLLQGRFGSRLRITIRGEDFLDLHQPRLGVEPLPKVDVAIGNPPYFKMSPTEQRGGDAPNVYARFMEVATDHLRPGGQLIYIVPRSFTSGLYYKRFRRMLHEKLSLERVHVFDSRREAFSEDEVLQENIIGAWRKGPAGVTVRMSASTGAGDLDEARVYEAPRALVFPPGDPQGAVFLPTSRQDAAILQTVRSWPGRLNDYELEVSTGPVVAFRTDKLLSAESSASVPMLWMQHVRANGVTWPLGSRFRKAEHIRSDAGEKLLVPNRTYILMRRFSPKEEARRLTITVLEGGSLPGGWLGLENHLNFIHRPGGHLPSALAWGLAAVLASSLIDDYFRILSGNTQVSATEIRGLPLPSLPTLNALGEAVLQVGGEVLGRQAELDQLVAGALLPS